MSNFLSKQLVSRSSATTSGYEPIGAVDTSNDKIILSRNLGKNAATAYSAYLSSPVEGESSYLRLHQGVIDMIEDVQGDELNWFKDDESVVFTAASLPLLHISEDDCKAIEKSLNTTLRRAEGAGLYKIDFALDSEIMATATITTRESSGKRADFAQKAKSAFAVAMKASKQPA